MPRFGFLNPQDQDPERAQLVQAYMVLHSQQTSVMRRLSYSPTSSSDSSVCSSPSQSPCREDYPVSPTRPRRRSTGNSSSASASSAPSSPWSSPNLRQQRAFLVRQPSVPCIPEVPEESNLDLDEMKLFDINKRIKATLTDLLNCDSVKGDDRMRNWVHTRLLDAQHTINQRRRHVVNASSHRRSDPFANAGWNAVYVQPALSSPVLGSAGHSSACRRNPSL